MKWGFVSHRSETFFKSRKERVLSTVQNLFMIVHPRSLLDGNLHIAQFGI